MATIILGVAVFVLVIVALVIVLLFAKSRLVSSADVTITVNDDPDKAIRTHAGNTLLNTLADRKIFVPSACGGKGTCGVCKVNVISGGGAMLPTEVVHISRGEGREGCLLSCQVNVKQYMSIELETEFDGKQPTADLDPALFARAVENVVQNSVDAMEPGGKLKVDELKEMWERRDIWVGPEQALKWNLVDEVRG